MTGFKRPFTISNNAAVVWLLVYFCFGRWTFWTVFATPPTTIIILVQRPRFPKHIDIIGASSVGKCEVVSEIIVVVAAETTHLPQVGRWYDHLNVINCVIQDFESKIGLDNYVSAMLADQYTPIIKGDWKVYKFIIQLKRKEDYCKGTIIQDQKEARVLKDQTHSNFPWYSLLDDYVITEDLHSDHLGNSYFCIPILLISLDDCELCQRAFSKIACFCQHICTGALEIEPFSIKGNVMRVTRSHTPVILLGVATINSIQKLTGLPWKTPSLFTSHGTCVTADTLFYTLRVRVDYVSSPVVTTLVGTSAVFHRHAGIPA